MTREEIREGIAEIAEKKWFQGDYPEVWYQTADAILLYLHSQGVVIKVDRELPTDTSQSELRRLMHIKIDALENGYVAWTPLIKEG